VEAQNGPEKAESFMKKRSFYRWARGAPTILTPTFEGAKFWKQARFKIGKFKIKNVRSRDVFRERKLPACVGGVGNENISASISIDRDQETTTYVRKESFLPNRVRKNLAY